MCKHRFHTILVFCAMLLAGQTNAVLHVVNPSGPHAAEISLISESRGEIILEFRLGVVDVDSVSDGGITWTTISVPGMAHTSQNGWPELPQYSTWLSIQGDNPRLEILEQETVSREWGIPCPAAEPLYRNAQRLRRVADSQFYQGVRIFPESVASITMAGKLSQQRVALLTCTPVQYQPRSHEWTITIHLRIRVTVGTSGRLDQRPPSHESRNIAATVVINPPVTVQDSGTPTARMLLVTSPLFASALQPFIDWKMQSGISVRTILYPGSANDANTLQTSIRSLCDSLVPSPEFLLLVGDVNIIPAFFGVSSSLTDHPYSLLDNADYLPDLSVGRIPCQTAAECSYWVQRLLSYERDVNLPANLTATVFSSAAALDPLHGVHVRGVFQSAGFVVNAFQEPETGTLSLLTNSLNAGPQWTFYIGHGYSQGWSSVNPSFTNGEAGLLTTQVSPIVISVACATADLDYPGMSLAESWISKPNTRGPLAYFGATESTAFFRSDTLGISTLRAVFQQGCERLGPAADIGRMATAQCFPQSPGGLTEETIQQFVLLGDPSMRIFSSTPHSLQVTYPDVLPLSATELRFHVRQGGVPSNGAEVCVMSDPPGYYRLRRTTTGGEAVFDLAFSTPLTLRWTITSRNAVPAVGTVNVVPDTGAFLQIGTLRIEDQMGDNDGNADRLEACSLRISLSNIGNSISRGGNISVWCTDNKISLPRQDIIFAPIAARHVKWLDAAVPVSVMPSAQDQDVVLINISMRTVDDTVEAIRSLLLHAPRMVFQGSSLSEDSGDGDGQPESGEKLSLAMNFRNEGGDHLRSPICSLLTVPSQIHVLEERPGDTIVAPGSVLTARTLLAVEPNLPRGMAVQYTYRLAASNTSPLTGWDVQRIGRIPVFLLVSDRAPQQVDAVEGALNSLGIEFERGTALPQDLFRYMSVWIFSGIYPNAVSLSTDNANRISQFLDGGGTCYWEGGDVWVFDSPNRLHTYFPIHGVNDGTSNAGPISGEYGTVFTDLDFGYTGENSFIDQLEPSDGGFVILRNGRPGAAYPVVIAGAGPQYRTIGSSIELGSLADGLFPNTRVHLFKKILDWFEIESRADIYPPTIQHIPFSEFPNSNRPMTIVADIQDASGLDTAHLEYRCNNLPAQTVSLVLLDGCYRCEIPGVPYGTTIRYRIHASDASSSNNSAISEEYTVEIVAEPFTALHQSFAYTFRSVISPRIGEGDGGSWAITDYPENVPVLELHGGDSGISFTTDEFDCSHLQNAGLSFWHYLRDADAMSNTVARILGSTDGGLTYPHTVWQSSRTSGGILEEGLISIPDITWMTGQDRVVLKFEYSGHWYWRLRDIKVEGTTKPVLAPVTKLVISVVPEGVKLNWPRIPEAYFYVVSASPVFSSNIPFQPITQINDTVFADIDDSFLSRYYQVEAVVKKPAQPPLIESAAAKSGQIRLPDLRWNLKLGNSSSR